MPNYNMAVWENHLLRKFVTVVIVLDGGVDIDKDTKIKVSADGYEIIVKQKLVERVANVDKLHQIFRKKDPTAYPSYHPKTMAFQKSLKGLKREVGDKIYNTARIRIPFQVQSDIMEKHKLGDSEGVRLLYVDLRAVQCENFIPVVDGDKIVMYD